MLPVTPSGEAGTRRSKVGFPLETSFNTTSNQGYQIPGPSGPRRQHGIKGADPASWSLMAAEAERAAEPEKRGKMDSVLNYEPDFYTIPYSVHTQVESGRGTDGDEGIFPHQGGGSAES